MTRGSVPADGGNFEGNKGIIRQFMALLHRNRLGELLLLKGMISPQELRTALKTQKETGIPLGQIFLKHAKISRRQLVWILARQKALRLSAALVMCLLSFSGLGSKRAKADPIKDVPAQIALTNISAANYAQIAGYPGLFGTNEKRSTSLGAFTKWANMFSRLDRQLKTSSGSGAIRELQENLESFRGLSLKSMAAKVNMLLNDKPYILDNRNWGQSDYWETPVEFMQRGGDCEDYAIAKYTALRMLGVPEERLRVAIVQDTLKNIPHAVLIVYTDEGTYALDNQNRSLVDGDSAGRYRPIFSINRTAWWLHTKPGVTQLASR